MTSMQRRRLFDREFCGLGRDILALSDGGGMVIAKAVDAEIATEIADMLNAASGLLPPDVKERSDD